MRFAKITLSTPLALSLLILLLSASAIPTPSAVASSSRKCERLLQADPSKFASSFLMWKDLNEPFTGTRPRGLDAIRKIAAEKGIVTVVQGERPASAAERSLQEMRYGTPLVYADDLPKGRITNGPGLALHPGWPVDLANAYRGEINPHIGYGLLHGNLSKFNETVFAEAVAPGIMAKSIQASKLRAKSRTFYAEYKRELSRIKNALAGHKAVKIGATTIERLKSLFRDFFSWINARFKKGAYLKQIDEAGTKDYGGQVTSFKSDPDKLIDEYVTTIEEIRKKPEFADLEPESPEFLDALLDQEKPYAEFVHKFLYDPDGIMIQERNFLRKTPLGLPLEFRVDFIDGEAVRSLPRHTSEYLPKEAALAEQALNDFFKRAPKKFRYLSGGADVAFTESGKPIIIEFNFGSESWFIMAEYDPISTNIYISKLLGRPTPLMQELEQAFQHSVEAQREILIRIRDNYPREALDSACVWLRDRYLELWRSADPSAGQTIVKQLDNLFTDIKLNPEDQSKLIDATQDYVKRNAGGSQK